MKKKKVLYAIVGFALVISLICVCMVFFGKEQSTYTVVFRDYDNTILKTEVVKEGASADAPEEPKREGYIFFGWNKDCSSITKDSIITAEYINSVETVFTVDTVTALPDALIAEVAISVTNNPGILGMVLSLNYDEESLKLVECQNGSALSALTFQEPSRFADGCNFVWYGSETGEIKDGEILLLTFEIADDAESKKYPISISWNDRDIYDKNCDMLNPKVVEGGILIEK